MRVQGIKKVLPTSVTALTHTLMAGNFVSFFWNPLQVGILVSEEALVCF